MLTADPTVVSEVVNEALALAEQTTRDAISKEAALAQLQGQYAELRKVAAARVVPPKGPQVELAVEQLKLAGLLDEDMSLEKAATYVKDPTNLLDLVIQITAPPETDGRLIKAASTTQGDNDLPPDYYRSSDGEVYHDPAGLRKVFAGN